MSIANIRLVGNDWYITGGPQELDALSSALALKAKLGKNYGCTLKSEEQPKIHLMTPEEMERRMSEVNSGS